jgi:hypothetical protein
MLPLTEARQFVTGWNATATPYVPWEVAEECLTAYRRWQVAILTGHAPEAITAHLLRHNEFARKLPDELLLMLMDESDD